VSISSRWDAMPFLRTDLIGITLVKGLSGPVTRGIASRTIPGNEKLKEEGFSIWDLADLGTVR
jgi:hypothetical protein